MMYALGVTEQRPGGRWAAATWIDMLATSTLSPCDIRKKGVLRAKEEDGGQQYVSVPSCKRPIKDNRPETIRRKKRSRGKTGTCGDSSFLFFI